MSFKLDLIKLARAKIVITKIAHAKTAFGPANIMPAAQTGLSVPGFNKPVYNPIANPIGMPKTGPKVNNSIGMPKPAPAINQSPGLAKTPGVPQGLGAHNMFGLQGNLTPQEIGTHPLFPMVAPMAMQMGGFAGLGALASIFGKDKGKNIATLTQGPDPVTKQADDKPQGLFFGDDSELTHHNLFNTANQPNPEQPAIPAPAAPPAPQTPETNVYNPFNISGFKPAAPEPQGVGFDRVRQNLGTIVPQLAWQLPALHYGEKALNTGLSRLYGMPVSQYIGTRMAKPLAHAARAANKVPFVGGLWGAPINAGIEALQLANSGAFGSDEAWNKNLEHFRNEVTPNGKWLDADAPPGISEITSGLNASMNPIRSSALLARDVPELIHGSDRRESLKANKEKAYRTENDAWKIQRKSLADLKERVAKYGIDSLSRGERIDYQTWLNRLR